MIETFFAIISCFILLGLVAWLTVDIVGWNQSVKAFQNTHFSKPIDLYRYSGEWVEIARLPNWFERDCVRAQAIYSAPRLNGTVTITNKCETATGTQRCANGTAWTMNDNNNALRVSFLPKFIRSPRVGAGDYYILFVDDNYETALVGSSRKNLLWLLGRNGQESNVNSIRRLLSEARKRGYDLSALIYCQCVPAEVRAQLK